MVNKEFEDDFTGYLFYYPLFSNQKFEKPDGNPILYAGLAQAVRNSFFFIDHEKSVKWVNDLYENCKVEPGLINRGSHKKLDDQDHDDYIGLVYMSYFYNQEIAKEIYNYGKKHYGMYNNTGDKRLIAGILESLNTRFPGWWAHIKLAAGVKLNFIDKFWWFIGCLGSFEPSGAQMQWLKTDLYLRQEQKYWLMDKGVKIFQNGIRKKYEHLMGSVFLKYFGPNHAFTKWMMGRI